MRTRILPLLITMLFALSLASNAAANENSKMTPGTIAVVNNPDSNDRLNLRTNPSPDAPTLGKYYNGTYLEVLSNEKNGWVKVSIFDLEGYMMAKFLVYPEQLEVGSSTVPSVKINNIGGTGLNLRKAQSTDSSSLGLYSNESTVRVFGVSETWCHVQTEDGNVGFMLRKQLSPVLEYQKSSNSAVVNNPNSIDRLNLRTKPSQEAPSLGKYYSGTSVEVLSGDENGWTKVRLHTLEGYMMTKYLVFGQDGLTGKDNALEAERDKAYAKDIVTMALKVVEKEQEQSEMNVNGLVQTNTNPDVIDAVVKAIDKSSNFKEGADGSSVEYVTNNGDKYVVTIDTQNLKVKDVN